MYFKQIIRKILPDNIVIKLKSILNLYNDNKMHRKYKKVKPYDLAKYECGINLIGDIKAETGLGQSMRIIAQMLLECNIPFIINQINSPGGLEQNDDKWDYKISEHCHYNINILHINPNIWAETYIRLSGDMLDYRYNIAYWLWELEDFPEEWVPYLNTVNEIWTPSEFSSNSIRKKTNKIVKTVPYNIDLNIVDIYDRTYFKLPQNKFLFLMMYDFKSISERKNPQGVFNAYKKAFSADDEKIGLIIKVNHLKSKKEVDKLKKELEEYKSIYILDKNFSRKEIESLIKISDVLVSLHRSEGFGLPLAEAMYLGTPVIATNWSAPVEFMDKDSACLVDYDLIRLDKNVGPYKKGSQWADANEGQAAKYMRRLYEDKQYYLYISNNAKEKIAESNGIAIMLNRIKEIIRGKHD